MANWENFYESGLALNDTSIHVSSAMWQERYITFNYGTPQANTDKILCFQYTKGVGQPSDMIDLTHYLPQGSIANSDVTYVYNDVFISPKSEEYYTSEQYLEKKALVERYVGWIVGDVDNPGICIFRDSGYNNRITLYVFYGYGQRNDIETSSKYGFWIGYLGNYEVHQMQQVFFTYNAEAKETLDIYGVQSALVMNYRVNPNNNDYGTAFFSFDATSIPQEEYLGTGFGNFAIYTSLDTSYWPGFLTPAENKPNQVCWGNWEARDLFNINATGVNFDLIGSSPVKESEEASEDNPYDNAGVPSEGGGGGGYPDNSDNIDIPDPTGLPSLVTTGLVKLYNPTTSELQDFTDFLFTGITESIKDTLSKLTTEPLQYLIGAYMTRFKPATSSSTAIRFAGVDTGATAATIVQQYQQLNCGYLDIPNASETHLDYSPYSSAVLYLPYIGYRDLNIDEIMGSRLLIKYNIDCVTGACTAYVHVNRIKRTSGDAKINAVIYEFQGNCFVQCPMSSKDSSGTIQALSQLAGAVGSVAQHNVAGAVEGAINAIATEKVSVNRNGSPGSNYGYSSIQYPYIILQRPLNKPPQNFASYKGWTSNMYKKVSSLKGYTEIDPNTIWTDNFAHATDEETQMIKDIMNGGVYL